MGVYHIGNDQIWLRIDRGGMGGGNSITMTDDYEYIDNTENGVIRNNHFITPNPGREHVFHWGLMANRNDPVDEPGWGSTSDFGEARSSVYNIGHSGQIVFSGACADSTVGHILQVAKTFMHELGHTLGLGENNAEEGTSMKQGALTTVAYKDWEWATLDFTCSGDIG